jgi:hypothetical protein
MLMNKNNNYQPLPPTPRANELRKKILESGVKIGEPVFHCLLVCENLERELAIASTGWSLAEKDNIHLTNDNVKLRRVLERVKQAVFSA